MLKILLVDDEESICKGMSIKLSMALDGESYEYRYALDGNSGVAIGRDWQPDIVIMDINLPDMTGMDAMLSMKPLTPGAVFLALSAYDNYAYVRAMLVSGALDYMLKPVPMADLRSALMKAVATLDENRRMRTRELAARLSVLMRDAEAMTTDAFVRAFEQHAAPLFPHARFCAVRVIDARGEAVQPEEIARIISAEDSLAVQVLPGQFDSALVILNAAAPEVHAPYLLNQLTHARASWCAGVSQMALDGAAGLHVALEQSRVALIARMMAPNARVMHFESAFMRDERRLLSPDLLERTELEGQSQAELQAALSAALAPELLSEATPLELEAGYLNFMLVLNLNRTGCGVGACPIRPLISFASVDALCQWLAKQLEPLSQPATCAPRSAIIQEAAAYIRQHYSEPISLRDLADSYYMNYTYFSELFKKEMGITVSQYITRVRMRHAIRLLRDPSATLSSIAAQVGYKSTKTFIQSFKKYTGLSPRKFYGVDE